MHSVLAALVVPFTSFQGCFARASPHVWGQAAGRWGFPALMRWNGRWSQRTAPSPDLRHFHLCRPSRTPFGPRDPVRRAETAGVPPVFAARTVRHPDLARQGRQVQAGQAAAPPLETGAFCQKLHDNCEGVLATHVPTGCTRSPTSRSHKEASQWWLEAASASRRSRRKGCPLRGSPFGEEVPTGCCAMLREVHQLDDSA